MKTARYAFLDPKYHLKCFFGSETGAYIRTGILDAQGNDAGVDLFMASFPHLIDVGIMGHCKLGKSGLCVKAGIQCYQSGLVKDEPSMLLTDL